MDNNTTTPAAPSQQPFSDSVSIPPDHVALRVTYMVTGNPRPPHSLGNLPLSTSIAALKDKIKDELPEHPSPAEQRLIYQGRPLLRTDATLRDILRIEPGSAPGPLPYTIHIVIQTGVQAPASTTNGPDTVTNRPPPPPMPAVHPNHHIDHLRAVEASATILQDSLSRIQQQIETNRADLLSVQQRISMNHHPASALQAALNGQPFPGPSSPMNLPHGQTQAPPAWMQPPTASTRPRPQNPFRTPAQPDQQNPTPGVPSIGSTQPDVEVRHGPHGERITLTRHHMNVPLPLQRPSSAPGQPQAPLTAAPQNTASPHLPSTFTRNIPMPLQLPAPPHFPLPFPQTRPLQARMSTSTPTAWILSSPNGPQAFLFAPGHGLFSNGQPPPRSATQHTSPGPAPTLASPPPVGQQQPPAPINQNGNVQNALIRPAQQPGQAPVAQIQQNAENNDLFNFLIHRGWLFLRLYLFMFVFSEPGTWKRWAMILIAAIVCLQPRDGPFVRAIRVARRHLDNLIGPPARPQAQPAAARQRIAENAGNADRAGQRPANVRGAVQMTPEEAAARLVREHREQNPNFWRDTFYRVEQSVALFLASLVPGVGERHIQAREEARRETQRLEEERQQAQQEALAQVRAAVADGSLPGEDATESGASSGTEVKVERPDEPSTSTSVQVNDSSAETGELRNRTT
ncbi:hypothetical protein EDD37DRAFT_164829 [Exophiala viscosa]|uniref:uncharacterized protein n=1 Tax=Exophiala viscosa TaxID=2486360 RepID=UPI00219EAFF8|nr:hypothetical protein EDD37DRAFT_164829 [Exophiala viscosa]